MIKLYQFSGASVRFVEPDRGLEDMRQRNNPIVQWGGVFTWKRDGSYQFQCVQQHLILTTKDDPVEQGLEDGSSFISLYLPSSQLLSILTHGYRNGGDLHWSG